MNLNTYESVYTFITPSSAVDEINSSTVYKDVVISEVIIIPSTSPRTNPKSLSILVIIGILIVLKSLIRSFEVIIETRKIKRNANVPEKAVGTPVKQIKEPTGKYKIAASTRQNKNLPALRIEHARPSLACLITVNRNNAISKTSIKIAIVNLPFQNKYLSIK